MTLSTRIDEKGRTAVSGARYSVVTKGTGPAFPSRVAIGTGSGLADRTKQRNKHQQLHAANSQQWKKDSVVRRHRGLVWHIWMAWAAFVSALDTENGSIKLTTKDLAQEAAHEGIRGWLWNLGRMQGFRAGLAPG